MKPQYNLQGNCSSALPSMDALGLSGAPLLPAAAHTCLVATDKDLLYAWHGSVWLDRLYMRLKRTARTDLPLLLHVNRGPAGALWATRSVFQGDGRGSCRALYADASALLLGESLPARPALATSARRSYRASHDHPAALRRAVCMRGGKPRCRSS